MKFSLSMKCSTPLRRCPTPNSHASTRSARLALLTLLVGVLLPSLSLGQGMPPEARKNIHTLFDHHKSIHRTVEPTDTGYVAVTESDDAKVAAALKAHVAQMGERLKSGMMVRRWDPAFAEYVRYYDDMEHRVESIEKGLRVVVNGKTAEAVKVAQNHAGVILDFVDHGWEAHDRRHPAAVAAAPEAGPGGEGRGACCMGGDSAKGCCRGSGVCPAPGRGASAPATEPRPR